MVAAIGSFTPPSPGAAGSPVSALEAQIVRYQKQLSDCVNCDSAKTIEGKAAIQQISDKIQAARARIEEITVSKPVNQTPASDNQKNLGAKNDPVSPAAENQGGAISSNTSNAVGSLINVVA